MFPRRSTAPDLIWADEHSMMTEQMWGALYDLYRMYGKDSGCDNPIQFLVTGDADQCAPIIMTGREKQAFGTHFEETFLHCSFVYDLFDQVATLIVDHSPPRRSGSAYATCCGRTGNGSLPTGLT